MCKSTLKSDRRIELFQTGYYDLAFDFSVNPESCENPDHFQQFLLYNALSDMKTGMGVTYVMLESKGERQDIIIGFVTLKSTSLVLRDEDHSLNGLPAVEISELAVRDHYEQQGIGKALIGYALYVVFELRRRIGVQYMLVCSEPKAVGFYKKQHFIEARTNYTVPHEIWNKSCVPMYMKLPEVDAP